MGMVITHIHVLGLSLPASLVLILPQWFIVGVCKSPAYEANAVIDSLTFHVHAYNQLNFLWIILLYWKLEEVLGMGPWAQCFRPKNFLL